MGYQQVDINTLTAIRTQVNGTLTIEAGTLQSLSLTPTEIFAEPAQIYAQIGLSALGDQVTSIISVLASGYIGAGTSLSWTGAITMKPGYQLFARISPSVITALRLTALTDQE